MAPVRRLNLDDEADFLDLLERFYSTHPAHAAARRAARQTASPSPRRISSATWPTSRSGRGLRSHHRG